MEKYREIEFYVIRLVIIYAFLRLIKSWWCFSYSIDCDYQCEVMSDILEIVLFGGMFSVVLFFEIGPLNREKFHYKIILGFIPFFAIFVVAIGVIYFCYSYLLLGYEISWRDGLSFSSKWSFEGLVLFVLCWMLFAFLNRKHLFPFNNK